MKSAHKIFLALMCLLGVGLACAPWRRVDPPGEGEKAARGYAACDPVIAALAAYQAQTGGYPDSLEALVPDYLAEIPQTVNDLPIQYEKTPAGYALSFSYTGPGMNRCTFTPEEGWSCSGFY